MSFLYPRVITVSRPAGQTGEGQIGYGGQTQTSETVIASSIPASIQSKGRQGKEDPVKLPGDGTVAMYAIFIPKSALAKGVIKDRDVITDELGYRYQVLGEGWDSLGYQVICQRLEA